MPLAAVRARLSERVPTIPRLRKRLRRAVRLGLCLRLITQRTSAREASVRFATRGYSSQTPESQLGEADPTERPLILRGVISINRFRTPSA
jgi:hypothetical protein